MTGSFTAWFALLLVGAAGQPREAAAQAACAPESEPVVEIVRSGPFDGIDADEYARANYDDFTGTISNGNFHRFWDGSCGSYKVPVRIVAPRGAACDAGRLAHVGLIENMHPFVIGFVAPGDFSGVVHGWNDPVYDPLLDHGSMEAWANLRAPFLFGDPSQGGSGVVYMGFQANNFFDPFLSQGHLDYIASLPENIGLGLHMDRPEDFAILYRDVSKWLRQAKTAQNFVNAGNGNLCQVSDVIGFGYSYTSDLLNSVLSNPRRPNSTWGSADPIFSRGRVMDGILLGGNFGKPKRNMGACQDVFTGEVSNHACIAASDASEGPVVAVRSEGDVQIFLNRGLRPGPASDYQERDHYKVHEINSASHIESPYFPLEPILEIFGMDPENHRQNPLDRSPVLRADLVNLLNKIRTNVPLPGSRFMQAQAPSSMSGLAIIALDPVTGNGFGGIALPQAAAPLGLYRGLDCHGINNPEFDPLDAYHYARPPVGAGDLQTGRAMYVLERTPATNYRQCDWVFSPDGQFVSGPSIEGIFTAYEVVDDALGTSYCSSLYPTRHAYTNRVTAAADQLVAERLLLPGERDKIIAQAEAEADKYPECVPAR